MHYEIAYVSQSGNTENLAYGIADALGDSETVLTLEHVTRKADIYLVGYEVNKGIVPLPVMDALDEFSVKNSPAGLNPRTSIKAPSKRKSCRLFRKTAIIRDYPWATASRTRKFLTQRKQSSPKNPTIHP